MARIANGKSQDAGRGRKSRNGGRSINGAAGPAIRGLEFPVAGSMNLYDGPLVYLRPGCAMRIVRNVHDRAIQLRSAIDGCAPRRRYGPQTIGREHVRGCSRKRQRFPAIHPSDSRRGVLDSRDAAGAGRRAYVDFRPEIMVADLRRVRDYGQLGAVGRPRELGDGFHLWAPPGAVGAVDSHGVNTYDIVFDYVPYFRERIERARIGQRGKSRSVGRDDGSVNTVREREKPRGLACRK